VKNIPAKCSLTTKNKTIKIFDAKSCGCYFENTNKANVSIIKIDGCVMTTGVRCDYGLVSNKYPENYVELKGGDVDHAIKQIINSMSTLSVDKNIAPKRCIIISTNNPLTSTQTQKNKLLFRKHYNAQLEFGRPGSTYDI